MGPHRSGIGGTSAPKRIRMLRSLSKRHATMAHNQPTVVHMREENEDTRRGRRAQRPWFCGCQPCAQRQGNQALPRGCSVHWEGSVKFCCITLLELGQATENSHCRGHTAYSL